MGAHTAAALALERRDKLAAAVFVGPVFLGVAYEQDVLAEWDSLADGLERGGVEGFLEAYGSRDLDPEWRDVLLRISKERIAQHRHPDAVAEALREVPRSLPFDGLSELQFLEIPVLVVASHDIADPGHPYAIAEAWAESLPDARLVSEAEGDSPLAWQGGRLSREIAAFLAEPSVSERVQG
jgi:3-oxoadipate enol-lactonase